MMKRSTISDYVNSLLGAETVNRCPLCGKFEGTTDKFNNHHIDHNPSCSEYWNLIRLCDSCHDELTKNKNDGTRERKVRQVKQDLFRRLIGDASYNVLLIANKYGITGAFPALALSLLRLELVSLMDNNPLTVGNCKHATIIDLTITDRGRELIKQLRIDTNVPNFPVI
jgi:hypothetical protein